MSYESHPDASKIVAQPPTSQLSVEAACFIPTNFDRSVASTSDAVPSYFGGYVWPGNEMKDASSYLRSLGQWHPYGSPGIPPPLFHYGQYPPPPPPIDYWPPTLGNGNLAGSVSPGGRPPDTFNSPYTDVSWNSLPLQEPNASASLPGASAGRPKSSRAKDLSRANLGTLYSPAASKYPDNSSSAVPSEGGEPVRTKKKKKKSRSSIIRIGASDVSGLASAETGTDAQSKNTEQGNSMGEKDGITHGSTSFSPDDNPSPLTGSKAYKNNDAQTDFSEELSRLTLLEKPSSLYDQSPPPDFVKTYSFTGNSSIPTPNSTSTVPSKPLLWTSIVSRTAVHPVGKTAASETNLPIDTNFKPKAEHSVNKKDVKKSAFDHSSTRSQSGKRKSTGISTSDPKQDPSSSSRTKHEYSAGKHEYSAGKHEYSAGKHEYSSGKHEYSSGKHEYSAGKQRDSLGNVETTVSGKSIKGEVSSLNKTKREVFVDGKRIQSSTDDSGRSQRVLKNINNDYQRQLPRDNGSDVFGAKREEEDWTPSAKQYKEGGIRDGKSRSPSWKRTPPKTAETIELSRSASGRRVPSTPGKPSLGNKPGVEKDKRQQSNSRKTSILQDDSSKQVGTTSAVKSAEKAEGGSGKRRRKNRKKKTGATEDGGIGAKGPAAENNASLSLSVGPSIRMQFDDDDEFPGLQQAAQTSNPNEVSSGLIKYSDILSGRAKTPIRNYASNRPKTTTKESRPDISVAAGDESDWDLDISEKKESLQKTTQKTASASRSISQPPKSTPKPTQEKRAVGAGAKTKEPITLSLFDMIIVKSKNKKTPEKDDEKKPLKTGTKSEKKSKSGNVLDSSGVQMRRGKEREVPKAKKPSLLRKVILKERESRRQKFLRDCTITKGDDEEDEEEADPSDLTEDPCDDGLRRHASAPMRTSVPRLASVSPSAARDASSPQDEPPATEAKDSHKEMLQSMIHSRRFREYCTQVLSKEIDDCCTLLLQELVRFQDRLYHKDPNKARLKRRIVLGLREVTKHLKARRIKCVIISPNLERIQSKGGLDEALHVIIETCQGQNIPFMFALSRKQLGKACCKVVPVSVVGIFSYEGAEEHFKKLKDLTEKARESYEEMVSNAAAELEELRKLYPEENWSVDGNVCDGKTSENMPITFPCKDYTDTSAIVGKTCPLSSCNTPGDAQDRLSPVDLVNAAQHPTQGNDGSYTNPFDSFIHSDLESGVTDKVIAETVSGPSLETSQVRENGGLTLEALNDVNDSGSEFIHVNTQSS